MFEHVGQKDPKCCQTADYSQPNWAVGMCLRACVCVYVRLCALVCGQEVVMAGLRSVAGKNGNYAVAVTTAGHSEGFRFPDTLQP